MALPVPKQALLLFGSEPVLKNGRIFGRALHPVATVHDQWPVYRKFLAEHLAKAVEDSAFPIPINVDHSVESLDPESNYISSMRWNPETLEVEYEGEVDDSIVEKIESGAFKNGVSVEIGFPPGGRIEFVNGSSSYPHAVPVGFRFVRLSLLKHQTPSDPTTSVRVWNNAVEAMQSQNSILDLKDGENLKQESLCEVYAAIKQRSSGLLKQGMGKDEIAEKIAELQKKSQEISEQLYPMKEELSDEKRAELEAEQAKVWAEIQAYEEALAKLSKDEVSEEVSEDVSGEADGDLEQAEEDGVESSDSEQETETGSEEEKGGDEESNGDNGDEEPSKPETGLETEDREEPQEAVDEESAEAEVEEKPETGSGEESPEAETEAEKKPETEDEEENLDQALIDARKQLSEAKAETGKLQNKLKQAKERFNRFYNRVKGAVPPLQAERSMSYGHQRHVQDLKKVLRDVDEGRI